MLSNWTSLQICGKQLMVINIISVLSQWPLHLSMLSLSFFYLKFVFPYRSLSADPATPIPDFQGPSPAVSQCSIKPCGKQPTGFLCIIMFMSQFLTVYLCFNQISTPVYSIFPLHHRYSFGRIDNSQLLNTLWEKEK